MPAGLLCGGIGGLAGSIAAFALTVCYHRTLPVDPQSDDPIFGMHRVIGAPSFPTKVAVLFVGAVIGAALTSSWIGGRPACAGTDAAGLTKNGSPAGRHDRRQRPE